jgi:hypothetical protein
MPGRGRSAFDRLLVNVGRGLTALRTAHRCTCGFTEADEDDETIGDHLLRVFTPAGDKGADGRVHLEGNPGLACLCGFKASTAGELDSHFLDMFARRTMWTPAASSTR